jgi:hypothetical protein
MDRRVFLKSTLIALLPINYSQLVKDNELERCLNDVKDMTDGDFIAWVELQIQMYISYPSQSKIITNIEEP